MRGKRSKAYRKLMQQYALTFGFREPYQVLIDSQMVRDAHRLKMDLVPSLSRTLHGQIKPLITHCSVRQLLTLPTTTSSSSSTTESPTATLTPADKTALIDLSRTLELRRCNHHFLDEPLSTLACHESVIDSSSAKKNKHHYILASQDEATRSWAHTMAGLPVVFVTRSVMCLEKMAEPSVAVRIGTEKGKLRGGALIRGKRKREGDEDGAGNTEQGDKVTKKKKKVRGPKGPNPLSMKKKKTKDEEQSDVVQVRSHDEESDVNGSTLGVPSTDIVDKDGNNVSTKRKRRRKHKGQGNLDDVGSGEDSGVLLDE